MKAPRFALVLTFVTAAVGGCRASGTEQPEPIGPVPEGSAELVWDLVTDFGMRPEDAKPAVDAAIAAARVHFIAHPDSSLVLDFPPGEWSFLHAVGPAIELAAVEGGGSRFGALAWEPPRSSSGSSTSTASSPRTPTVGALSQLQAM